MPKAVKYRDGGTANARATTRDYEPWAWGGGDPPFGEGRESE